MTRERRITFQYFTAAAMLLVGVALAIAGFIVSPLGEIHDSVLYFTAQCFIYAGSVFGVSVYVSDKFLTDFRAAARHSEDKSSLCSRLAPKDKNLQRKLGVKDQDEDEDENERTNNP